MRHQIKAPGSDHSVPPASTSNSGDGSDGKRASPPTMLLSSRGNRWEGVKGNINVRGKGRQDEACL